MQAVHRKFGKFMKRSADESQVAVLLKDFDDADKLLTKIIDSSKAWRDAWTSILTYQSRMVAEFEGLYAPIIGSSEGSKREPALTPEKTLARTAKLREEYEDLRKDLLEVISSVDERMIGPATQAKDYLIPMKKTIKKREDTKLDFERYQSRVDNAQKKTKRSDRDNAALAKAEMDLANAKEIYNNADENLRQHLPGIVSATFSLLPQLLFAQIEIQNTLLANYYTSLYNYCGGEGFPSPPAEMDQIIQVWEADFLPIQQQTESLNIIASGKNRLQANGRNGQRPNSATQRRPSSQMENKPALSPGARIPPSPMYSTKPQINSVPSPPSSVYLTPSAPSPQTTPTPSVADSDYSNPQPSQPVIAFSPAAPKTDYFSRDRQSSAAYLSPSGVSTTTFAKKKPPPPPPPRAASPVMFVTALYDFAGQGAGDLSFREGDRIRVIKRTESTDDWWQGELRGVKGSFPANYCE